MPHDTSTVKCGNDGQWVVGSKAPCWLGCNTKTNACIPPDPECPNYASNVFCVDGSTFGMCDSGAYTELTCTGGCQGGACSRPQNATA